MTLFLWFFLMSGALAQDAMWSPEELTELGAPGTPRTSEAIIDAMTEEIGAGLRCPVCQGMPVSESPAKPALTWKNAIRDLVTLGYNQRQIEDFFVRRHGEWVLLQPRLHGANWILWLLPYLLFGAALALLGAYASGTGNRSKEAGSDDTTPDPMREHTVESPVDRYEAQILAELDDP